MNTRNTPDDSTSQSRFALAALALGLPMALLFCQALQQGRGLLLAGRTEMLLHCAFMR